MLPPVRPAVLLVDDDLTLLSVLARRVARAGLRGQHGRAPGPPALKQLEGGWPALIVVDLMMPGMDGFELCRRIKLLADLPIIVLSAVDESEAKVSALELYAEDYVTKPFDPDELVARIQRVLRRSATGTPQITLDGGDVTVDLATRRVTTAEGTQQLTPTEARLLAGPRHGRGSRRRRPMSCWTASGPTADGADPPTCGSPSGACVGRSSRIPTRLAT